MHVEVDGKDDQGPLPEAADHKPSPGLRGRRGSLMKQASVLSLLAAKPTTDFSVFEDEPVLVVKVMSGENLPHKSLIVSLSVPGSKGVASGHHPIQTAPNSHQQWDEDLMIPLEIKMPENPGTHKRPCCQSVPVPFTLNVMVGGHSMFVGQALLGVIKPWANASIVIDTKEDWPGQRVQTESHAELCSTHWSEPKTFRLQMCPKDETDKDDHGHCAEPAKSPPTLKLSWKLKHVPAGTFVRTFLHADMLPVPQRIRPKIEAVCTRVTNPLEFVNSLDTGDIFLTIADMIDNPKIDTLHVVSEHCTGSEYVHMGMFVRQHGTRGEKFQRPRNWVVPEFAQGQLQVLESTMGRGGVWCYAWETGLTKTAIFDDYIMVRKLQGVQRTREWRAKVEAIMEKWVGTPFDGGEMGVAEMMNASRKSPRMADEFEKHGKILRSMDEDNAHHRKYFFCSELVSMVYQHLNLLPEGPHVRSDFFTPGAFTVAQGAVDKLLSLHGSGATFGPEMLLRYPGSLFELNLRKLASMRAHTENLDAHAIART